MGFVMQTYTIYTQCDHCGVYDRDTHWCTLCRRPKEAKRGEKAMSLPMNPPKTDARLAGGLRRRP